MGDAPRNFDLENLWSYCDDLVGVLRDKRDIRVLSQCLEYSNAIQTSSNSDFNDAQSSIRELANSAAITNKVRVTQAPVVMKSPSMVQPPSLMHPPDVVSKRIVKALLPSGSKENNPNIQLCININEEGQSKEAIFYLVISRLDSWFQPSFSSPEPIPLLSCGYFSFIEENTAISQ
ncbi:hypothetical protein Nepgr_027498 [Nepenthes gracilis]|uniref:Uncharacterized protein n=1 Tax=Nepenthes gracilis TaxID=150966 RepID=A0AAD3T8M5_NEPGR|nr:hypothetical protein Nepgr_027498 [Nepenthes gracilis]